jgi:hypothetical protein
VLIAELLVAGVLVAGTLESEPIGATATGSAWVIVTKKPVVSNPMQVMFERMCFMIIEVSLAGQDKTEVTICKGCRLTEQKFVPNH